jgi:hypothetical protein
MRIEFEHHIESSLSADHLWSLLVDAFSDSRTNSIWPREFETLRSDGLEPGATVRATYHIGPNDVEQTYDIPEFDDEERRLVYRNGPKHPLDGGAEVRVEAQPDGCVLHWQGGYDVALKPQSLGAAAFTKLWFEERFFGRLRDNIRAMETTAPAA